MEYKANINRSNVGTDEEKITLSYFVIDAGSMESADEIKEEFDVIVKKYGGVPKESKKSED